MSSNDNAGDIDFPTTQEIAGCNKTIPDPQPVANQQTDRNDRKTPISNSSIFNSQVTETTAQPSKVEQEMQVVGETMAEGVLKYGMPGCLLAVAGTFFMRRRHQQIKATPFEAFALSALHYYAAVSIGLFAGLKIYEPTFDQKILDRIPDSTMAQAIRDKRKGT